MITLHLNDQEVSNVLEGLSNMPLHKSFDTFISVRNQVMQQRQPPQGPQQGVQAPPAPPVPPAEPGSNPNGRDTSQ